MNIEGLQRKLIAAARAIPPDERVPYAFDQRVLAALRSRPVPDLWQVWSQALWRAAAPCVAVLVLLGAWSMFDSDTTLQGDFSQDFEDTVLAAVAQDQPADTAW
jgi:ABC-type glycerol-3-phosphate transport system substrate-binding protein